MPTPIERVVKCLCEVLALEPGQVKPDSRLMQDLGAESLDLVELIYLLESEFAIRLSRDDLSLSAQIGLAEAELHVNEVLTPRALERLRERYPGSRDLLREGIQRRHLAALLTVEEVARAIEARLPPAGAPPP